MGSCVNIESQNNTRLILELAHERNEKLVSYIRLTDGAIWGFLGIAIINLFGTQKCPSTNVPLFLILLSISMFLWRRAIKSYQKEVVKGYYRMVNCENILNIPYDVSIRKNLENSIESNPFIRDKPQNFHELCELLTPEKYKDGEHIKLDIIAIFIFCIAILGLIFWFFNPQTFFWICHSQLCII
jgi:hypothetical protein